MKEYSCIAFLCLLLLIGCTPGTPPEFKGLSAEQAQAALTKNQGVKILDIRTPAEYMNGHIQGAKNVDYYSREFKEKLNKLDKSSTYLVYCRSGNRSDKAMALFRELGFTNILHLKNGVKSWVAEGLPLVQ
jgi:rhodanese-related sulfurtransferase